MYPNGLPKCQIDALKERRNDTYSSQVVFSNKQVLVGTTRRHVASSAGPLTGVEGRALLPHIRF